MLWIGNVRGRYDLMKKSVQYARKQNLQPAICGDLILQGRNPVECISLALQCANGNIVIGHDTMTLFHAMSGSKDAWVHLKKSGGIQLIKAISPFESMVQDLFDASSLFYRDLHNQYIVVPISLPRDFHKDADLRCHRSAFFTHGQTAEEQINTLLSSGLKSVVFSGCEGKSNKNDGVFYLNSGKKTLAAYQTNNADVRLFR